MKKTDAPARFCAFSICPEGYLSQTADDYWCVYTVDHNRGCLVVILQYVVCKPHCQIRSSPAMEFLSWCNDES